MLNDPKTISGWFWRSDFPDDKVPGTAELRDGRVSVSLLNEFSEEIEEEEATTFNRRALKVVVGEDHEGRNVILLSSDYRMRVVRSHRTILSTRPSYLLSNRSIWGTGIDFDNLLFYEAEIEIEGLVTWSKCLQLSGYHEWETNRDAFHVPTVGRYATTPIEFEGMEIRLVFEATYDYRGQPLINRRALPQRRVVGNGESLSARSRPYFRVIGRSPLDLARVVFIAKRLSELLSFGLRGVCPVSAIHLRNKPINPEERDSWTPTVLLSDYVLAKPVEESATKIPMTHLFDIEDLSGDVESLIFQWLDSYEKYGPMNDAYFHIERRPSSSFETKILYYSRVVEGYWNVAKPEPRYVGQEEYSQWLKDMLPTSFPEAFNSKLRKNIKGVLKTLGNRWFLSEIFRAILDGRSENLTNRLFTTPDGQLDRKARNLFLEKVATLRNKLSHGARMEEAIERDELPLAIHLMRLMAQICLMQSVGFSDKSINQRLNAAYRNTDIPLPGSRLWRGGEGG